MIHPRQLILNPDYTEVARDHIADQMEIEEKTKEYLKAKGKIQKINFGVITDIYTPKPKKRSHHARRPYSPATVGTHSYGTSIGNRGGIL